MQIEIIRQQQQMDELTEEWNTLLKDSASDVPFLRCEYLSNWWSTRGGGEWPEAELYIAVARRPTGQLAGIAPLFFARNKENQPALLFLGSIEISDYLDFIAAPADLPAVVDSLLVHLARYEAPPWQVLDLYNLPESSPTIPVLSQAAEKRGWHYSQEFLQNCPCIFLPEKWEMYLGSLDKKQRHEIRRKMRRADEYSEPVSWYIASDPEALDGEIDAFFELMAYDQQKKLFLTPLMRQQMRQTIHLLFQQGQLQLAFIQVGSRRSAAYLNIDYGGRLWVYNSGFDPNFRELSLGWVLLGHLIQWSIANRRAAFDFMRGSEDYKYRFGAVDRRVVHASVRC